MSSIGTKRLVRTLYIRRRYVSRFLHNSGQGLIFSPPFRLFDLICNRLNLSRPDVISDEILSIHKDVPLNE